MIEHRIFLKWEKHEEKDISTIFSERLLHNKENVFKQDNEFPLVWAYLNL